ncbi:CDP-glycerol glycerophosphotransferase family protein [Exiguobacterium aurantiacum]|uniref:CDP-glycerol glycerophosphotransferase family protein n=1 Tax=Exiguobacterium aurantiacum TaxID=33987 RepID=UPI00384AD170
MKNKLKKILPNKYLVLISRFFNGNYMYILWLLPIKKDKVVICNYYGKGYGDSAKYIVNEITKNNSNLEIVWLLKSKENKSNFPSNVRVVKYGSMKGLYELATSRVWIDNCRKYFYPPKRKEQFYIQTWHSPLRLKKIEKDAGSDLPYGYIEKAKADAAMCNLMISGCDFSKKIYENSFWYSGDILECGTPRCDLFFDNKTNKEAILNKINLKGNNSKILLYAPTFRKNGNLNSYLKEYNRLKKTMCEKFGGDWIILVRMHPNVSSVSLNLKFDSKNVIDVTDYDDMQELLYISDVLITDYSSCMFDMAIAKKICFLYGPDLEEYLKGDRELYFDVHELPFMFSDSYEKLIQNIHDFNLFSYYEKLEEFNNKVNFYESGESSSILANKVVEYTL